MAICNYITETKESFTLELNREEIKTLLAILRCIVGDPNKSQRKYSDQIYYAILESYTMPLCDKYNKNPLDKYLEGESLISFKNFNNYDSE